jgi:hypothetical protein
MTDFNEDANFSKITYWGVLLVWGILQVVLIILRAVGILSCSWWMIFLPIIIPVGGIIFIILLLAFLMTYMEKVDK